MKYEIAYTKAADKFFVGHENVREKYENAIDCLLRGDGTVNVDCKKIQGMRSCYYRIRIGNYRIVYTVINGKIVVVNTLLAGARGDVYKKMKGKK